MSTYAISDIHGMFGKFRTMLKKIDFKDSDKLYVLGDMVDRGDEIFETVEFIMGKSNIFTLIGNHEQMLLEVLMKYGYDDPWTDTLLAGTDTRKSFEQLKKIRAKDRKRSLAIVKFLRNLPFYFDVEVKSQRFVMVHAGLKSEILEENQENDFLWIRDEFYDGTTNFPYKVIFGHTPTAFIDKKCKGIWWGENKIGIDAGACFSDGKLACLRLEDMQEFYV